MNRWSVSTTKILCILYIHVNIPGYFSRLTRLLREPVSRIGLL